MVITPAVAQHGASATTMGSTMPGTSADRPNDAAVAFTQQDSPLLRLPGELRNRIYCALFASVLKDMEDNNRTYTMVYHFKDLRPTLRSLIICRQIHHEAMAIIFRTFVAERPGWLLHHQHGTIARCLEHGQTKSLCLTMKHYAPHARFGVKLRDNGFLPENTLEQVRVLVEELARQVNNPAKLSFEKPVLMPLGDCTMCHVWRSGRAVCDGNCSVTGQDIHWKLMWSQIYVTGSVGGFEFIYFWDEGVPRCSRLHLAGCLTQLDWDALEEAVARRG